jgi:hypothetical protein
MRRTIRRRSRVVGILSISSIADGLISMAAGFFADIPDLTLDDPAMHRDRARRVGPRQR